MEPMWSITVRQYGCDYENLAPKGCDQYYFDNDDNNALDTTGTVQSFNFNNGNGRHLANQDQTICIRRDAEMQRVCFSQAGGAVVNYQERERVLWLFVEIMAQTEWASTLIL